MTWANIKSTGRGKVEYRLVIQGCQYVFCTARDAEQTAADGRIWVATLQRDGLVLEESVDVATAEMATTSFTASFVDRDYDWVMTTAFAFRPSWQTTLEADLSVSATTFSVRSASGISAGTYVHIGTEAIKVTGTGPYVIARGQWDTTAQKHYTGNGALLAETLVYVDRPLVFEGRRVLLYAYGEGDTITGAGTLVWRGIVATEPQLTGDGVTWTMSVESLGGVLNQDLGGELEEEVRPRGIYYHSRAPLVIEIGETAAATPSSVAANSQRIVVPNTSGTAFFEDTDALVRHLNTQINTSGWDTTNIRAASDGRDSWWIEYTTAAVNVRYPRCAAYSSAEGWIVGNDGRYFDELRETDGDVVIGSVSASTTYKIVAQPDSVRERNRGVPRGVYGYLDDYLGGEPPDETTAPRQRMYIDGSIALGSLSGVQVEWPDGSTQSGVITSQNAASRWIEFGITHGVTRATGHAYGAGAVPVLRFTHGYVTDGTLDDWRDAIVAQAATRCNVSQTPLVTSDDLADWSTAVSNAAAGRAMLLHRRYASAGKVKLDEFLSHECRLLGVFPAFTSGCAITLKPLTLVAPTETAGTSLTEADIECDDALPTWERNKDGSINTVLLKWAYNLREDKHAGEFQVRDATAYAMRHAPRTLEIAPYSEDIFTEITPGYSRGMPTWEDAVGIARQVLGIFGRDHAFVTLGVSFKAFGVFVGSSVAITCTTLPDVTTGTRSVTGLSALVVGRRWDLDQGRGTLTLLTSYERLVGYAPSLTVVSRSGSGNDWTITIDETAPGSGPELYASSGDWVNHWEAGYLAQLVAWDSLTPSTVDCTIDATPVAGATTIDVTTAAAWTLGASTWVLVFREGGGAADPQDDYAYLADAATGEVAQSVQIPAGQYSV